MHKGQILVIDDDSAISTALCNYLQWEGFTCITACNGKEALAALEKHTPSLIILDLRMPIMGGQDFLAAVRVKYPDKDTPVIVLSAFEIPNDLQVQKMFKKPFEMDDLLIAIKAYCRAQDDCA